MSGRQERPSEWIEYDYAVVRLVPRVHLGMFLNIGVVVHARRAGFIEARFHLDVDAIRAVDPGMDLSLLGRFVEAYRRVGHGGLDGGPIGMLPPSERFHWLTSPRSAVLQTSPVHPGCCHDLEEAIDRLLQEQCCR
jgi:hypothetical protein